MAKGKYQKWLEKDGLLLLKAWARDGLTDEQMAHNMELPKQAGYWDSFCLLAFIQFLCLLKSTS